MGPRPLDALKATLGNSKVISPHFLWATSGGVYCWGPWVIGERQN